MTRVPLTELSEYVRNVRTVLKLAPRTGRASIVYLMGDLGAGKTTFVQTLARDMGIGATVQSPTYVLMKSYGVPETRLPNGAKRRFTKLVHIDAYRLERPEDFAALKPETFLNDPEALVLVEWPERIEGQLPKPDMIVRFSAEGLSQSEREIEMQS